MPTMHLVVLPRVRAPGRVFEESYRYYQLAESIELNTGSKDLSGSSSLTFNQHKDIYEGELNSKAKEETERALR